jgi:guanylate kinase
MTDTDNKKGKLVIISGPSGVGKGTICAKLVEKTGAFLSTSTTTREKGEGEIEGQHYQFISAEQFKQKIKQEYFLEYANVFGNYYGTPWQPIEDCIESGRTVLLEIDVQGAIAVKKVFDDATMIFILPPHKNELEKRMGTRARGETQQSAQVRLEAASQETAKAWQFYDHMVINEDLEQAVHEIIEIINTDNGANV